MELKFMGEPLVFAEKRSTDSDAEFIHKLEQQDVSHLIGSHSKGMRSGKAVALKLGVYETRVDHGRRLLRCGDNKLISAVKAGTMSLRKAVKELRFRSDTVLTTPTVGYVEFLIAADDKRTKLGISKSAIASLRLSYRHQVSLRYNWFNGILRGRYAATRLDIEWLCKLLGMNYSSWSKRILGTAMVPIKAAMTNVKVNNININTLKHKELIHV